MCQENGGSGLADFTGLEGCHTPGPYLKEFRGGVVRVVLSRDPGVTIEQIAKGIGSRPGSVDRWVRRSRVKEGFRPEVTRVENEKVKKPPSSEAAVGAGERRRSGVQRHFVAGEPFGKSRSSQVAEDSTTRRGLFLLCCAPIR